ncbi:MAG: hypothetical protein AAGI17_11060 [Planctomycetota bacterium]
MNDLITPSLPILLIWSAVWCAASLVGLWRTEGRGRWPGFWFMSGLWSCVNAAIVAWSMLAPPESAEEFRRLLMINAGLDLGYLATGVVLITRKKPILKGFGAAILVQGSALLVFDLIWFGTIEG